MRNLLAFIGGLVVTLGLLGWYLGWFRFVGVTAGDSGNTRLSFDINQDKIRKDVESGVQRGREFIEKGSAPTATVKGDGAR